MINLGIKGFDDLMVNNYVCEGFLGEFEKGNITNVDFRNKIRQLAEEQQLTDGQIDQAWCSMLKTIPSCKLAFVRELNKKYRVFMLSNTNDIHIKYIFSNCFELDKYSINDYFEECFLWHKMKLSKPDPQIFLKVLEETGTKAEETLFIDDSPGNISAANQLGIQGYLYKPGEDLRKINVE